MKRITKQIFVLLISMSALSVAADNINHQQEQQSEEKEKKKEKKKSKTKTYKPPKTNK